jgi:HAMP domain-containing protein
LNLPLRARTVLLFLAGSLVPLVLAGVAAWVHVESNLVAAIVASQRQLIAQIRLDLEAEFGWYRRQLETLSNLLPVQSLKPEPAGAALESFLAYHLVFHQVALHAADGRVVASATRGAPGTRAPAIRSVPAELERAFRETLSGGKTRMATTSSAAPCGVDLHLVCPVPSLREDGAPGGVVIASVRRQGAEIQELLEGWGFVSGTYVLLTDPDGEVVARAGSVPDGHIRRIRVERTGPGRPSGPATADDAVVAGVGVVAGRDDLVASAALPEHGLVAVVGRPYAEVSRTLEDLLRAVSFYVLVGIMVALVLGVLLSRAVVSPILAVTQGILRVARGEVAHRLPAGRNDELGDAARAFNEMAAQLQKGRLLEELWEERRQGPGGGGGG